MPTVSAAGIAPGDSLAYSRGNTGQIWHSFGTIGNPETGFCFTNLCKTVCPTFCTQCAYIPTNTLYMYPQTSSGHPAFDPQPTTLTYNPYLNEWIGYSCHYGLGMQGFDWIQWQMYCKNGGNAIFPDLCATRTGCFQVDVFGCTQGQTLGSQEFGQVSCNPWLAQGLGMYISQAPAALPTLYGCFPQNNFLIAHVSLIGNGNEDYPLGTLNGNYPLQRVGPAIWQCYFPLQPPFPDSTPNQYGLISFGSLIEPTDIPDGGYSNICYGIGIYAYDTCAVFGIAPYPPSLCNESGSVNISFAYNDGSGAGIYDCSAGSIITVASG